MAAETQYKPITGMQSISTANSNLDGSGALSSIIITGDDSGTFIKTLSFKAITDTGQGMLRIYLGAGETYRLFKEIEVPAVIKSATDKAFEITVPMYFYLKNGLSIKVSTQNADTFNIIAETQNWGYYTTSVRAETTMYTPKNNCVQIDEANEYLDGGGSISTVFTSGGCNLQSITIKAIEETRPGMIRLYLNDGTNTKLWKEIEVNAVTPSSISPAFYHKITFEDSFALESGWELQVSTEQSDTFNIIAEYLNWAYPV